MADETDDPEIAASRLEAALERIARRAAVQPVGDAIQDALPAELAGRLDGLIERLRGALDTK